MALVEEKRRKLGELVARRRAALANAGTSAPVGPPSAAAEPAPIDNRQKGDLEATTSEEEGSCMGLIFKRKRAGNFAVPSHSASDGHAPSFRDNPPSASSPPDLIMHEGGGRVLLKVTKCPLRSNSQPSSNKPSKAFRIKRL